MAEEALIHKMVPGGVPVPIMEAGNSALLGDTRSGYTVYEVTSGRSFKLRTLMLTNDQASRQVVTFYDSTSDTNASNRLLKVTVGAEKTEIVEPTDILGVREVVSSLIAFGSLSGQTFIHAGGYEY